MTVEVRALKTSLVIIFTCVFILLGVGTVFLWGESMGQNRLGGEKSPYLLQHKENPIWWQPWGEEAFELARKENKPIFLSVGYSTCHWCHVMAHETFENEDIAKIINKNFISIKVDREERPDVDSVYMTAIQQMTGQGGWPMSVWLTPEGVPFFGGTYFPRERFAQVLYQIADSWKNEPDRIISGSKHIFDVIRKASEIEGEGQSRPIEASLLKKFLEWHDKSFDEAYGGFGRAPKFPQTMNISVLIRAYQRQGGEHLKEMILSTLDHMSEGGMYDHLMGGFHRYSTDERWLVPHFEKMLYDNALLTQTYLEAYQVFKKEEYKFVVEETLDYILREMTHPEGGFYSAQDADSFNPDRKEKEEGYFCTFSHRELAAILSEEELNELVKVYGVSTEGQYEGRNILHLQRGYSRRDKEDATLKSALSNLRYLRSEKPQPHLDDKIITAWNGWMVTSLAKAYQVLGDKKYLEAAQKAMHFIKKTLWVEGKLLRRWREGEAKIAAYSDDYAALISGTIALYESDFNPMWLDWGQELQKRQDELFWDHEGAGYFRDDGSDKTLLIRAKEDHDGVRPSSNSLAALNLLKLYGFTYDENYKQRAEEILSLFYSRLELYPAGLPQMFIAVDYMLHQPHEIAIVAGEEGTKPFVDFLNQNFIPNKVLAVGKTAEGIPLLEGKVLQDKKTTVYICQNKVCTLPTNDLAEVKKQLGY